MAVTLREARSEFVRFQTARWLGGMLAAAVAVRVALGGWGVRDLVVGVALVALQPFTEWLIHVYILHFKPRVVRGRRVDLGIGVLHRRHHQAPKDPRWIFIPMRAIRFYAVLDAGLLLLAWRLRPSIATAVAVATALTLSYEWTHYLIHTDYRPRTRLYRGLWRAHRLHHFRNENYWYGVTGHLGDRVLRTYPAKEDVPLSPTATTLGVDVAA
ncbi:MAG TPA: sterol desaturase family protein [Mycobacteriales bacterium]|jgi:sterol desaturase/sphingolipid hydroxylase (fatty acid hydroxylase superfamily)